MASHCTGQIRSPLNYIGGKYRVLEQILPLFPKDINTFVDVFAGGCNVGINVNSKILHVNDRLSPLIALYRYLYSTNITVIIKSINDRIRHYGLSKTNEEGYKRLLHTYNTSQTPLDLFVVTCFSFNHQIRFNNDYKLNISFGKNRSQYNKNIEHNLVVFCNALQQRKVAFTSGDFRNLNYSELGCNDFVYCDPPYLLSNGSYNDGRRGYGDWKEADDVALRELLDSLHKARVRFALSNVIEHKGIVNKPLLEWSRKYTVHKINCSYSNCSYHLKDKNTPTKEVLICNY